MENTSGLHSTDQIISAVDQLSLSELERVFDHVLALQAERKAPHLSPAESKLLVRINQGLPPELRERLALLKARREDESITEQQESHRCGDEGQPQDERAEQREDDHERHRLGKNSVFSNFAACQRRDHS
jgi:hypothetical protein